MARIIPAVTNPDDTIIYCINTLNAGPWGRFKVKLFGRYLPDYKEHDKTISTKYYKGKIYLWGHG